MKNFDKNTISVLITGTSYPSSDQDWRGRFIADMVNALSCRHRLSLRTWLPPGNLPLNVTSAALPEETYYLERLMRIGGIANILSSKKVSGVFWTLNLLRHLRNVYQREGGVDVMHINWLQNAIPLWNNHTPAVITVLGTDYRLLKLPGMIPLLRAMLKKRKAILAPNAHWMKRFLEKQFGDIARILPIPFGVHSEWFNVRRQLPCQGPNQWLTVSRLTKKKIGPLFEWGRSVFGDKNILTVMGPNQENLTVPEWIIYKGATYPEELKQNWFPSTTGLITLSKHDEGRPQVILEAMAAGIPVIASDLAAHRDVVIHKTTGWIVTSPEELEQAVDYISISENNRRMGNAAKNWIKEHIGTWENCAQRYESAYAELTGKTI